MEDVMKRTQIYLSEDLHNKLEDLAFVFSKQENKKVSMSEVVRRAIKKYLKSEELEPNEDTLQAMAELEDYKNMKSYSLEEFLKNKGLDKL
jgi:metal-responsive CopG/Arc/MetJ family transcriptional regulator